MLGALIRKLRRRLPHYGSASKFAASVGCTREHYRRIEAGTGFPSKTLMEKLVEALEVSPSQAQGLWVAWSLEHLPPSTQKNLLVVPRDAGSRVAQAVLTELLLQYDLSDDDGDDLKNTINKALADLEVKWLA